MNLPCSVLRNYRPCWHVHRGKLSRILSTKRPSFGNFSQLLINHRCFGQPAVQTHPHLLKEGEVTPGISKHEYNTRRKQLLEKATKSFSTKDIKRHIMIFPAAPRVYMTYNIPYPFRQNTEFLYLCGFQEPNSVLVLESQLEGENIDKRSTLFVQKKDPFKELWDGARSGIDGTLHITGIDAAFNIDDLDSYLYRYCRDNSKFALWYNYDKPVNSELHYKVLTEFLKQGQHKYMEDSTKLLHQMRLIKSKAEVELMKNTCEIASQAFKDVMKFSYPRVNESYLYAKMDFECRIRDAEILAYHPVVAGGNRANTIHYVSNNQIVEDGELVLMDAGCEYHGYTSDITRTWPVSGKFSPAQRALYEAVLRVQSSCIKMCTPEYSMDQIHFAMLKLLRVELQRLHIIPTDVSDSQVINRVQKYCPHHVSHYLGMDVHDTAQISRGIKLQPGMVITIEPGVYIPETDTEAPSCYRGNAVRIEDNILITSSEPIILTKNCPKHPDDIESLLATR